MTLSAYFATAAEHQQLAWMNDTILEVIAPGGLERAFREAGWDLHTPPPEGWACTPDAVATAMAKLGCTILGPPPGSAGDNPIPTQSQS
jgi:hypothetical protein